MRHQCCYLENNDETKRCQGDADYRAVWGKMPDDYTEGCYRHILFLAVNMSEKPIEEVQLYKTNED
jgi:hypothetical protein